MDSVREILRKQNMGHTFKPMTQEEREKHNAESFNSSIGHLNESDGYNCDICHNKGLIMRAYQTDSGLWTAGCKRCRCMKIRTSIRYMKKSGLENIITDYTFDKFKAYEEWQGKLKNAAIAFAIARKPEGWFFIGGQSGAGKTHLCAAICREFLLGCKEVRYMLWRDEIVKLKGAVNDTESYQRLIGLYKDVEVLYIDDLFKCGKSDDGSKQRPTPADINIAFEILNYRYNDPKLLTVISSECTVNDIMDIDEAVGGRIFEKAAGNAFSLKPDKSRNYRLKNVCEL